VNQTDPIRVVIRNPEGQYLVRGESDWAFSPERARAIVFDYQGDRIAEQLDLIRKAQGPALEAVSVESVDFCEKCDRCGQLMHPSQAFFNGIQLLCPHCKTAA
jgi:hypothetical protein